MFRNDKKGRLYGVKKDVTFVDNPPLEDTTTKITSSINFSKSNFLNLGKWILIIVLFLYFGSYTINGFIASNITKDSTEETIVHEYKKQIGTEIVGGDFNFISSFDDFNSLIGVKIYPKELSIGDSLPSELCDYAVGYYNNYGMDSYLRAYDYQNNPTNRVNSYYAQKTKYSRTFYTFKYAFTFDTNYIITDISLRFDFYYMINESYSFSNSSDNVKDIDIMRLFMNTFYINDSFIERPIYETTTYTYQVKDINYNWDYKLKQISKFRPLFKSDNIYFKNEEYSNLINLNTFIIPTMSSNEYKQKIIEEKILIDEKVVRARDLGIIKSYSFSSYRETSWFNDNDNSFFYLTLNDISSSGNYELTELVYYLNSNYVTNYTKDNYKKLLESDNFGFDDLIIFPIRLVGNLVYNFGVLIGIITIW